MTNYDLLLDEMRKLGMDYKWSRMFVKKLADDEKAFPMDMEKRKWAMERGFFPGRIELYDLNNKNERSYIPDYQYFMLHPLNNHFKIWVNDKLSLKYILNSCGCEATMPEYYLYVENDGSYTYLMDCPNNICKNQDFIWNLLQQKQVLAMKPNSGTSGGRGFIKLELRNDVLYENNKIASADDFQSILSHLQNYVITEYIHQHHELQAVWPDSECTLRVIMCKDIKQNPYNEGNWSCAISYARFGTSINGGASNLSSGGVGVGFDFESGQYNDACIRYKKYCPDGIWKLSCHPDTKIEWKGAGLPNWDIVKGNIKKVCAHIDSLSYLGFDIIITENGMKFCEINTHPAMDYEQVMCGPSMLKPKIKEYFEAKGLYRFDGRDFFQAYIKSQE